MGSARGGAAVSGSTAGASSAASTGIGSCGAAAGSSLNPVCSKLRREFETEPAAGWAIADLEIAELTRTLDEAIWRGRMDSGTRDPVEMFRGFGLIRDGQFLRAAAVLLGNLSRLGRMA